MKNILLILVLFFTIVSAKEITPYKYVQASEAVTDFVKVDNLLIIGTEEGIIDIYDLKKDELIDQIKLPKVKNIFGNDIRSLITSVDYHQGKIIFIKRLLSGYHELYLYENKKLIKLIDASQYFSLKKVKFVNEKSAIIAFMSNEIMLYDLKNRKIVYKKLYNLASLSDIVFDEKALDPFTHLALPSNVYTGEEEYMELGKKLSVEYFETKEDGVYLIETSNFFSIIEILDETVKYRFNRIPKFEEI